MANTKITSLTELAATPASDDVFPIVDVSDTTMAGTGTTKKIQASRFSYLTASQTFTGVNTFENSSTTPIIFKGSVGNTNPIFEAQYYTGTPGLQFIFNPGNVALVLPSIDNGSSYSGFLLVNKNSNASTPSAGHIVLYSKTTGYRSLWVDDSGNLRIIGSAQPTNATDTSGTVVGAQTSNLASKDVIEQFTDYQSALQTIIATDLYNFTYKSGAYNGQEFTGLITDYAPTFGVDKDDEFPNGKSLNEVTAIGYCMAAIKALSEEIELLKAQVSELQAQNT